MDRIPVARAGISSSVGAEVSCKMGLDNVAAWVPIVVSILSLVVAALAFQTSWHGQQPRLHVDSWRVHDRVEYYTLKERDLTELPWGLTFEVHHAAGAPAELTAVMVNARSPFVDREPYSFRLQTPKRVVSPSTPYKSTVYNVPPDYTVNLPPHRRATLLEVTITYIDRRLLSRGKEYHATFCGRFQAGGIDGGGWYVRAESWDQSEPRASSKSAEETRCGRFGSHEDRGG